MPEYNTLLNSPPLCLLEPPSANRWWRHVGAKTLLSREAREYKEYVANVCLVRRVLRIAKPTTVRVDIVWHRGRKAGDLDKRIGILLDALQGSAYDNDSQIVEITARRLDDPHNPRCYVSVNALEV